jgi:uncharacterized protein
LVSDITTNGSLLTVPLLERLVALGVSDYQITFDGPRRFHDRRRVRAGGAATFDTIWGRLEDASRSASPFRIQVRLHVDRDNEAAIPEFLEAFVSAFGHDERFNLFIRGLSRLGGPRDESLPILEGESRSVTIESLRNRARDLGIRLAPVPEHSTICYAARGNSFIVRADGRINKCTVALDHPANQVGTIGEDGALQLRAEAVRPWMRGLFSGDRGLMACPKRGLADGTIPVAAAADRRRVAAAVVGAACSALHRRTPAADRLEGVVSSGPRSSPSASPHLLWRSLPRRAPRAIRPRRGASRSRRRRGRLSRASASMSTGCATRTTISSTT